jgi:hypothetical protein
VSSNQDFGVEQFFRADEFQAVDPSPLPTSTILDNKLRFFNGTFKHTIIIPHLNSNSG